MTYRIQDEMVWSNTRHAQAVCRSSNTRCCGERFFSSGGMVGGGGEGGREGRGEKGSHIKKDGVLIGKIRFVGVA